MLIEKGAGRKQAEQQLRSLQLERIR